MVACVVACLFVFPRKSAGGSDATNKNTILQEYSVIRNKESDVFYQQPSILNISMLGCHFALHLKFKSQ